ncbi:hypothetical protein J4H86_15960 [Spiractinospora alimapuensis]|uniref:DUF6506 family protein n=1 Tax=Spiractinospora alimapuensis TaxID=2820884 RepID=UPI001F39F40D|nr:DUF6506 family protein [Spiractinospora alimapuensis]QVQ50419.1 hypothetical protein J4H86_15960 [Spiractinospora alimapuensis]
MNTTWASVFEHPDTDPSADRTVIDRAGQRTLLVPVADQADAPRVAKELVEREGVSLIELCGGFATATVAAVIAEVGDRVAVGHVTYSVDAIRPAAAYAEQFTD